MVLPEPHVRQLRVPRDAAGRVSCSVRCRKIRVRQYGPATISQQFEEPRRTSSWPRSGWTPGPGELTAEEVNALRRAIAELGVGGDGGPWEVKIVLDNVAAATWRPGT